MELQELLKIYFANNRVMHLATVENGQPWMSNVYFVTDEDNSIYWTSAKNRRHSKEIVMNPVTAATIVHDGDKKQAVQITGKACMVPMSDVERVHVLYCSKFGDKPSRLTEVRDNTTDGRAYWVLNPVTISFWDEVHFPDAPKQEFLG